MEGPTPVSALIHAATMVTAGVYMVARMHVLYSARAAGDVRRRDVGAATAFYSATIGLMQTDIKRVLAYSTICQLGYMFLGCGVGAYAAGIFHLMTHAFFKGLLFLAAGSVIHAMGGEQDMRNMGGLRKKTRHILDYARRDAGHYRRSAFLRLLQQGSDSRRGQRRPVRQHVLWTLGILGALLTSFYMFRLLFLTFFGEQRYDEHKVHVHESPKNMTVPLMVLAILAVGGGWFAAPTMLGGANHFENFLRPVFDAGSGRQRCSSPRGRAC